ncbi:MAG: hypothetical protein DME19_10175 [Verrucomicrobia bacterium]|nr:MAG: hypothetical protein DME19_10175 [Verrucomicrobiota bacterium]
MSKILVIEDDVAVRAPLAVTLEQQGFEVLQAGTGAQGVQMARTELPNLILCGVELEGVGGNLVLYAVRRDPKISTIPFILMSGFAVSEPGLPGLKRGADGFLAKPFTPATLTATIDECLSKRPRAGDQAEQPSGEPCAEDSARSLIGLLPPIKQIVDATKLISTAFDRLEAKEIIGLATQAHQVASNVYRRIERGLFTSERPLVCSPGRVSR